MTFTLSIYKITKIVCIALNSYLSPKWLSKLKPALVNLVNQLNNYSNNKENNENNQNTLHCKYRKIEYFKKLSNSFKF